MCVISASLAFSLSLSATLALIKHTSELYPSAVPKNSATTKARGGANRKTGGRLTPPPLIYIGRGANQFFLQLPVRLVRFPVTYRPGTGRMFGV